MSAACIRYRPAGDLTDEEVSAIHYRVAERIEADGRFWIGTTRLKGRAWFRACPVNYRTTLEHMDQLMELLEHECAAAEAARCS